MLRNTIQLSSVESFYSYDDMPCYLETYSTKASKTYNFNWNNIWILSYWRLETTYLCRNAVSDSYEFSVFFQMFPMFRVHNFYIKMYGFIHTFTYIIFMLFIRRTLHTIKGYILQTPLLFVKNISMNTTLF